MKNRGSAAESGPSYAEIVKGPRVEAPNAGSNQGTKHNYSIKELADITLNPVENRVGLKNGKPAVFFSEEEFAQAARNLEFALVMRFFTTRSSIDRIREVINNQWGLKEHAAIGHYNPNQILLRTQSQEDMLTAWSRNSAKIDNVAFRLTKWECSYLRKDSPLVSTWVRLPSFPVPLCTRSCLETCVKTFAKFIAADADALHTTKPSYARICIQVDASRELPDRFWMGIGNEGYWQRIVFENAPRYCTHCCLLGHRNDYCRRLARMHKAAVTEESQETQPPVVVHSNQHESSVQEVADTIVDEEKEQEVDSLDIHKGSELAIVDPTESTVKGIEMTDDREELAIVCEKGTEADQMVSWEGYGIDTPLAVYKEDGLLQKRLVIQENTGGAASQEKDVSAKASQHINMERLDPGTSVGGNQKLAAEGSTTAIPKHHSKGLLYVVEDYNANKVKAKVSNEGKQVLQTELNSAQDPFHLAIPTQALSRVDQDVSNEVAQDIFHIIIPPQTAKRIQRDTQVDTFEMATSKDFLASSPVKSSCTLIRHNSDPGKLRVQGNTISQMSMDSAALQLPKVSNPEPIVTVKVEPMTARKRGHPAGSTKAKKTKGKNPSQSTSEP